MFISLFSFRRGYIKKKVSLSFNYFGMSEQEKLDKLNQQDIDKAIEVLQSLLSDTNQLFEIEEEKRVELLMAAGKLSRPDKDEFQKRRKDAKKAAKRKMIERDKHARKSTGMKVSKGRCCFCSA